MGRPAADPSRRRLVLDEATALLEAAGVSSPRVDAEILLAHVLGRPRGDLVLVEAVPATARSAYADLVARRADREPLQHLTGHAGFRTVDLAVGPGVFVPRPETELLVGWALKHLAGLQDPVVVDLGTGSGAIAKAVATEAPHAQVHAVELDVTAHAWAERNLIGTGVALHQGDLAECLDDLVGRVDVVLANPPYIPLEAWESVAPEARDHDPHLALFSGPDGLDAVRAVVRRAAALLGPGGLVGIEHADVQGAAVPALLAAAGRWREVVDHEDLAGRPRFTTARLAR